MSSAAHLQSLISPLVLDDETRVQSLVYEALRDLLVSGQLQPGDVISLRHAAAAFGVSVTPVREALRELEREGGLVAAGKNRTLQVPSLPAAYVSEIAAIRINLEGMAAENAARQINRSQLRLVENAMKLAELAVEAGDHTEFLKHNWRFHHLIYRAAEMPVLLRIIESLWVRIGPGVRLTLDNRLLTGTSRNLHQEAFEALKRADGPAARAAIAADIRSAADNLLELKASGTEGRRTGGVKR